MVHFLRCVPLSDFWPVDRSLLQFLREFLSKQISSASSVDQNLALV